MTGLLRVPVELGDRSYDVVVGSGALAALGDLLPASAKRAVVVTQPRIGVDPGLTIEHEVCHLGDGEGAKTMASVEELCRSFARFGLTRADVVVAVGGGMVTDVAGFAAAVYHRGVAVVHVATTLLAQVDAAIGGKTGVNLPEGKNLVGAFWQPSGVVCDTDVLRTLPPGERRSGLGELAKYHFLTAEPLTGLPLEEQIARAVAIKAEVVASDEREGGRRAILNYGHTLGHALEVATRYELRHGEAVAVGLVFAAHLARRLGRIGDDRVREHYDVVGAYDLPVALPDGIDDEELEALVARDKKNIGGTTFVLDGSDGVEPVVVDTADVRATLAEVRAR
ncbi:MAG TPA: 3-dehydroquinate synthase family protein [Acidimicrobiales bacterium]